MKLRLWGAVCTAIYIHSNAAMAVSFMPLGDLAGGDFRSSAVGVSADGSVVVGGSQSASGYEAFRWMREGGMQSVASILTTAGVDLTGWVLDTATGVSADGYTIVGNGIDPDGFVEAWIADLSDAPPTPHPLISAAPSRPPTEQIYALWCWPADSTCSPATQ